MTAAGFKSSKVLGWVVKLGLTLGAFWFALKDIDFSHLKEILNKQDGKFLLEAFALLALQIALGGFRWQLILNALANAGHSVMSVTKALRLYYITVFFNNCLPGTVGGDVVRVWLAKGDHVPIALSINSVIIDRMIALVGLGVMVFFTLPILAPLLGFDSVAVAPIILIIGLMGMAGLLYAEKALTPLKHIRPVNWFLYFVGCLRQMVRHPFASLLSMVYAIAAHASFCVAAYVLAQSMDIELSMWHALTLLPLIILTITLPISIGGWGVREASMVGILGLVGVPKAAALMLSIQLGLFNVLLSLPAGLLWLAHKQKTSLSDVVKQSQVD